MKYGMAMKLTVYDYETEEQQEFTTTTGDYLKSSRATVAMNTTEETAKGIRENYAFAWCALKRLGKLDDYGLGHELTEDTIDDMANKVWVEVEAMASSRPTRPTPKK